MNWRGIISMVIVAMIAALAAHTLAIDAGYTTNTANAMAFFVGVGVSLVYIVAVGFWHYTRMRGTGASA